MLLIMMKTGKCLGNEVDVCKDFNLPLTEQAADFDTIFKALEVGGGQKWKRSMLQDLERLGYT